MPTYDYECFNGHRFEAFQKMSDEPVAECPDCGAEARRLISGGAGFLFKGEGFYITDYRSEEYRKKASADAGGPDGKSGSADGQQGPSSDPDGGGAAKTADGESAPKGSRDGGGSETASSSGSTDS